MTTRRMTVLKIAGAGGDYVRDRFTRFKSQQKKERCPDALIASEHWTPGCRRDMEAFAEQLRENSHELPTVFAAECVDLWGVPSAPSTLPAWEEDAVQLLGNEYILECYALPDAERLEGDLKRAFRRKRIRDTTEQERRWALVLLQEALRAWRPLVTKGVLVWLSCVLAPTVEDDELTRSLEKVPTWLKKPKKRSSELRPGGTQAPPGGAAWREP